MKGALSNTDIRIDSAQVALLDAFGIATAGAAGRVPVIADGGIGGGSAALEAAISARQAGANSIVLLEKAPPHESGGNAQFSHVGFRFVASFKSCDAEEDAALSKFVAEQAAVAAIDIRR